ncbi:MAG: cold-shock protein [Flexibacteraceae bacterium]|jgi:CspA family cold shock protein
MKTGIVKFFNETKGFGFIVADDNNRDVFVHVSNLSAPLNQNDRVSFEIVEGKKGQQAVNVTVIS